MDDTKTIKKVGFNRLILTLLFFFRTGLLVPTGCFGIYSYEPHFNITVQSVVFLVLLVIFSVTSACFVLAVQKSFGNIQAVICLAILSDPVYFVLQDDSIKLFINTIVLLAACFFAAKKYADIKIICPLVFISSFLLPFSVFCYVPLLITEFIACNIKKFSPKKTISFILLLIGLAISGVITHKLLYSEIEPFKLFIDSVSFADLNTKYNKISFIPALLPMMILTFIFSSVFIKQNKKLLKKKAITKKESEISILFIDIMGIVYSIVIIGFIIFDVQSISVANIILLSFVLILLITENRTCITTVNVIIEFIKAHKFLAISILLIIHYLSFKTVYLSIGYPTLSTYIRF